MRRVFALQFFPRTDSRNTLYIRHLRTTVQLFHGLIVELVRFLLMLARPNNQFRREVEILARQIGWRVGFLPSDGIEHFISQFLQATHNHMDVMVRTTNPNRTIVFQFGAAHESQLRLNS